MNIDLSSIGQLIRQYKTPENKSIDEWEFYVKLAGDHHTAFVLRRVIYWTANSTTQNRNGWFFKTHQQMSRETAGLSPYQIRKAQKRLQKIVLVKHEQKDGKTFTWYKLKQNALLKAIGALISRYTGKSINIGHQKTNSLRQRFSRTGSKKLTHQSDTSYSNNQTHDNQSQTSINQEPNEQPTTTPPAQPIDDDLKLNLPDWLKGFSFNGECDVAEFIKQIDRLGESEAKKIFEKTSKIGKSWQYHLNSFINAEVSAVEKSVTPPTSKAHYVKTDEPIEERVQRIIDNLDNPPKSWREQQKTQPSDRINQPLDSPSDSPYSPKTYVEAFDLAMSQLEHQLGRSTFDTWLRESRIVDVKDNTAIIHVPNSYAEDTINKRLYRNIRRVFSDVINKQIQIRAVENWAGA